jgi:hypothetical protein
MGRPLGRTQDAAIHFRVDATTLARLDALVVSIEHLGIHRSGVLRACLLVGLDAAEKDVMRVLVATSTKGKR